MAATEKPVATLVKVQLPIDVALAIKTGKAYADRFSPFLLVYDRKRKHVFQGSDDLLKRYMFAAGQGTGFLKAFMLATWDGKRWVIDYAAGFQPMQNW